MRVKIIRKCDNENITVFIFFKRPPLLSHLSIKKIECYRHRFLIRLNLPYLMRCSHQPFQ